MRTFEKEFRRWLIVVVLAAPSTWSLPALGQPAPEHRIGVRVVNGAGEFYDRVTGQKFVPRGSNYIRLGPQTDEAGNPIVDHSTFNPGSYSASRAETALERMRADGYNVVRVFLSQNGIGDRVGGLSSAYLKNVVDFLNRARANEIIVLFTQDGIPDREYAQFVDPADRALFSPNNLNYLSPSGLRANRAYFQELVRGLIALGAPLDAILAFELRNELYFDSNLPPLSLTSGKVLTADALTYDMGSAQDKQRMIDENLPYWMDQMRAAIQEVDPTALVTCGFFVPREPNRTRRGDPRLAATYPAIWQSQADFIDLHLYPTGDLNLPQYVENFQIDGMQLKPILMGEFGAFKGLYPTVDAAAQALAAWQAQSVQYGFDGWLLWTWDTAEQPELYNGLSGDGKIEKALSPAVRPDPSTLHAPGLLENNIALGKNVTASVSLPDQPAANAVDGTPILWNAGAFAPQWVQIDLGQPSTIQSVRLTVAQYPDGETVHQLWVGGPSGPLHLVKEFAGLTRDPQVLEFKPAVPLTGVQSIRVVTVKSPSWVAWKEIEVIAP